MKRQNEKYFIIVVETENKYITDLGRFEKIDNVIQIVDNLRQEINKLYKEIFVYEIYIDFDNCSTKRNCIYHFSQD